MVQRFIVIASLLIGVFNPIDTEDVGAQQALCVDENLALVSAGPVVYTDPAFPTQTDDIILYFDATMGNGALSDFNGDVYAHTGVITSQSTAPNDWKHVQGNWGTADANVLMTKEDDNLYSLSYNIEDFYGINPGEIVEQLAFVFRNADGSIVGRELDGGDIFHEVFPEQEGLLVNLISPDTDGEIIFLNDSVKIDLEVNQMAWLIIRDNGDIIFQDSIDQLESYVVGTTAGQHTLSFDFTTSTEDLIIDREYFVLDDGQVLEDPPAGVKPGINYHTTGSYIFSLTAPMKEHVFLLCPENEYKVDINFQMKKSLDGNSYWIELPKVLFENGQNSYQYLVDGLIRTADPFSTVVLDPWNDDDVPADVLAALPAYPETMTTGIVTAFDLEEPNYDWQINEVEKVAKSDLVIYEILMRDFLADKNYKSLLDTLDYLENLGVNAIELMPIQEFEGNQSWGYNPSYHMAVDKYYGSRDQLKAVIDACHQRGIMVILDVVFNHAFSQSPLCQLYWNPADFRPTEVSPYLNVEARHPFNVGYDFNHESPFTREWVKQVLEYWISEFKFDGFRFDLSKGMTQTFSGTNAAAMAQFDLSRVNILTDYAEHIWSLDDESYVILEHFANNNEEQALSDRGMMLWGNMSHDFTEAAMGYSSNLQWADYTVREWNDPHLIAYMESHDEERMGYKLDNFGNNNASYDTRELETGVERVAAASTIYFSIPGPKMLWQFGELHYDFSINRCTNGSISDNCRLDPKPVRWDYAASDVRNGLYDKIAALTFLKTNYPTFSTTDFELDDVNTHIKTVHLNHPEMDAVSLANFRITLDDINPKFPYEGTWYEYFTGNELIVGDTDERLDFLPGEHRIYTSERLTPPGGYFTSVVEHNHPEIQISPNPISIGNSLTVELFEGLNIEHVLIESMDGRRQRLEYSQVANQMTIQTAKIDNSGMYVLIMVSEDDYYTQKIILLD